MSLCLFVRPFVRNDKKTAQNILIEFDIFAVLPSLIKTFQFWKDSENNNGALYMRIYINSPTDVSRLTS
jgi:hypothetical protein